VLAVVGWFTWRRDYNAQQNQSAQWQGA